MHVLDVCVRDAVARSTAAFLWANGMCVCEVDVYVFNYK